MDILAAQPSTATRLSSDTTQANIDKQIRIWLYTPILHTATSIMSNLVQTHRVVDLAKETIRCLTNLNSTTNMYRRIQVFYHQFLTSAISVLFLASVHAPVQFSAVCREEFYMALELVKDLSAKSWVSKRLWRTIGSLKEVAPRFGLGQQDDDAHSTAAMAMAGLASGGMAPSPGGAPPFVRPTLKSAPLTRGQSSPGIDATAGPVASDNGTRIQKEMRRIFEGYVGMNGIPPAMAVDDSLQQPPSAGFPTPDSSAAAGSSTMGDDTVFRHLREMY
jgi:hypothetical protein